jgi:hypothetical protein
MMIDTGTIVALLLPGPCTSDDIIAQLGKPAPLVRHELARLVREGTLKRVGQDRSFALPSYVAPMGRPPMTGQRRGAKGYLLCARCGERQRKHGALCRGCARAAGVYIKSTLQEERERVERQIVRHKESALLRAPVRLAGPAAVRVVDGVEYQVVDYEALLQQKAKHWPSGGSSLSAPFYERPRQIRRELRRGGHA